MARPDHSEKIPLIQADFRTGNYSQRDLAKKHGVSLGFVAKHTANLSKDLVNVVNAGIVYKHTVMNADEQIVNAVNAVIDEKLEIRSNIQTANAIRSRLYKTVSQHAHKKALEAIGSGDPETLKESMAYLQVGNTAIQPVHKTLELETKQPESKETEAEPLSITFDVAPAVGDVKITRHNEQS